MDKSNFLKELKKLTPKQLNNLIEEKGKRKLIPLLRYENK